MMRTERWITSAVLVLMLGLVGCSSNEKKQLPPAELQRFEPQLSLERLWSRSTGGYNEKLLSFVPAVVGDRIYVADAEGDVLALRLSDGRVLWKQDLDQDVSAAVGADGRHLYLGLSDGRLLALSQDDGSEVWSAQLTSEMLAPPQAEAGLVVVQTIDGKLFGLEADSGRQRWVHVSAQPVLSLRGTSTPLMTAEATFAGFDNGEVVAIDNRTGTVFWSRRVGVPTGRTELERLVDIDGGFVLNNGVLYTVGYQGQLVALDAASGRELWTKPASSLRAPVLGYSNVYVVGAEGEVIAYGINNQATVWRQDGLARRGLGAPAIYERALVVGDFEGYVHFLSQVDGQFLARIRPDSDGVRSRPLVHNGVLYILGNGGELSAWRIREHEARSSFFRSNPSPIGRRDGPGPGDTP